MEKICLLVIISLCVAIWLGALFLGGMFIWVAIWWIPHQMQIQHLTRVDIGVSMAAALILGFAFLIGPVYEGIKMLHSVTAKWYIVHKR